MTSFGAPLAVRAEAVDVEQADGLLPPVTSAAARTKWTETSHVVLTLWLGVDAFNVAIDALGATQADTVSCVYEAFRHFSKIILV